MLLVGGTGQVLIPSRLARRVREEAEKHGLSVEEYLVELLSQGLDPGEKATAYIEASISLLDQAREELRRGDVRQAAEKLWGAAALAVKAYAYWREGKRLASHRELWEYTAEMMRELGDWVRDAWANASDMHTCFYEGWCTREHVEAAVKRIEKLVDEIALLIQGKTS